MKLLALAAVLLVFLVCPNVEGRGVARVSVAFSFSWDSLVNRMRDDVKKMEVHIKNLEGKAKSDAQNIVDQVKALLGKRDQYILQGLTSALEKVTECLKQVDNYLSQEYAELKAEATKLQEGLIIALRKLLLEYFTQMEQKVIQWQAFTTSLEGELKTEAEEILTQLKALLQKGAAVTIGDLNKMQNEMNGLSEKMEKETPKVFAEIDEFLQTVVKVIEQQLLSQIQGYLNKLQAETINLEGEAKERLEALITQLKAAIENGEAISIQVLTNIANGLQKLSQSVEPEIAKVFEKIIAGLQAIIESLKPSQQ